MFEELLNKRVREFLVRTKKGQFASNIIIGSKSDYYVEYFQERLYWVYNYGTEQITMIFASSPKEAVEKYEQWV